MAILLLHHWNGFIAICCQPPRSFFDLDRALNIFDETESQDRRRIAIEESHQSRLHIEKAPAGADALVA
jgi:hypothetical protein